MCNILTINFTSLHGNCMLLIVSLNFYNYINVHVRWHDVSNLVLLNKHMYIHTYMYTYKSTTRMTFAYVCIYVCCISKHVYIEQVHNTILTVLYTYLDVYTYSSPVEILPIISLCNW